MMMIVDTSKAPKTFDEIAEELDQIGSEIGVVIKAQREEIFNKMHRI
jgi:ACT domain-containing protein